MVRKHACHVHARHRSKDELHRIPWYVPRLLPFEPESLAEWFASGRFLWRCLMTGCIACSMLGGDSLSPIMDFGFSHPRQRSASDLACAVGAPAGNRIWKRAGGVAFGTAVLFSRPRPQSLSLDIGTDNVVPSRMFNIDRIIIMFNN